MDKNWVLKVIESSEFLELHRQFYFKNRYEWQTMAQSEMQRTLSGGFVVQRSMKISGRSLILSGENAQITRQDLSKLQQWAGDNLKFSLESPKGEIFKVIFDAKPYEIIKEREIREDNQGDEDKFRINLFFITC